MQGTIDFVHTMLAGVVTESDLVVDATAGNGKDTVFMASRAEHVFAFDIQKTALKRTEARLFEAGLDNVTLIHDSHVNIPLHLNHPIKAAVFNLGYLPGGDKNVTTHAKSTVTALEGVLSLLVTGGVIAFTAYPGHAEGKREAEALERHVAGLSSRTFETLLYRSLNKTNAPYAIIVKRKQADED